MHTDAALNNKAGTAAGLLPQEITIEGGTWLDRARHYSVFSHAWYLYRSLALLTVTAILAVILAMVLPLAMLWKIAGWPNLLHMTAIVLVPVLLLCLMGPGLAVMVRQRALPKHMETGAIVLALLAGATTSVGLATALVAQYAQPYFDADTGVLVTRALPHFQYSFTINTSPWTMETSPEIDRQYRPGYVAPIRPEKSREESMATLYKIMSEHGFTRAAGSDDDKLNFNKTGEESGLLYNLGPIVSWTLPVLYGAWLGGVFDLAAFLRQRARIVDVLQREELRRTQIARNAAELRLSVLAAQIEPHFLFNTLASVRSAIATDPRRAAQIVDHMVSFLRSTIPQMRDDAMNATVNLSSQMASERIPRLRFSVDSEPGLEAAQLPPLMLISLVENAVKHGVEPKIGEARVDVMARRIDNGGSLQLEVSVTDDGVGFGDTTSGDGIGLANIQERLRTLFGAAASLSLKALPDGGVAAILRLPLAFGS